MAQIRAGKAASLRPGDQIIFKTLVLMMAVGVGIQDVGNGGSTPSATGFTSGFRTSFRAGFALFPNRARSLRRDRFSIPQSGTTAHQQEQNDWICTHK